MQNIRINLTLLLTVLFLSSCAITQNSAVTQNIGGRREVLSVKSLSTLKPGRKYTFYNKNGNKHQVKVLKIDSAIVYGRYQGNGNELFEKSFEEIVNENHRVTTVSRSAIAGKMALSATVTVLLFLIVIWI